MDDIVNIIVTDIEETITEYNLACSVEVYSFCVISSNDGTKIIVAVSESGDILQKWSCIYINGKWTSSSIATYNFVKNDVCNETNCVNCYLCELPDIEECHKRHPTRFKEGACNRVRTTLKFPRKGGGKGEPLVPPEN